MPVMVNMPPVERLSVAANELSLDAPKFLGIEENNGPDRRVDNSKLKKGGRIFYTRLFNPDTKIFLLKLISLTFLSQSCQV